MQDVREYAPLSQGFGAGVVNAAINGGFGWLVLPAGGTMPLLGMPSVVFDLLAMTFGVAFGTGLVVTPMIRAAERQGKLRAPTVGPTAARWFSTWPSSLLQRSIQLGVLGTLVFAPLPLLALFLLWPDGFDRTQLIQFKAVIGFIEGAIVTPPIAIAAFVQAPVGAPPTMPAGR